MDIKKLSDSYKGEHFLVNDHVGDDDVTLRVVWINLKLFLTETLSKSQNTNQSDQDRARF